MLHEMNLSPDSDIFEMNDSNVSGIATPADNGNFDSGLSAMQDNRMIDPDFSVMPEDDVIDPDFSVMPDYDVIDPDFSVMPDYDVIDPDFSVNPNWFPIGPGPVIPCPNCFPFPTQNVNARFINASPEFSGLTVEVDNRIILTGMDFAEVSRYRRYSRGFHRVTVMAANGFVFLQQNVFIGNNSTIAIVSSNNRMNLTTITDGGCSASFSNSCFRVCNLAYASGAVNVILSNGLMSFTNTRPGTAGSFSRLRPGSYPVSVARSARPAVNLLSTFINLNPNRVYTLYVLNWNPSPDTIQILLVEDMR